MKPKQKYNPLINENSDFISPNRRTYRQLLSKGLKSDRVGCQPVKREEPKVMNGRTKAERKELAKKYGSQSGELKKKHIARSKSPIQYGDVSLTKEEIQDAFDRFINGENNE